MDQTTMSTKGMILLLLSVLEFKLGVYTFSTQSLEMDQCGWDVKVMGYCPLLPSNNVSWTCLANLKACDGGLKYHCARGYGKEEDKFVEACRKSKVCIMGREPRISFEPNNNIEIFCELCFDVDHYNSVPTKSSTEFSECPYKKIICSEHQIECKKTNNPEASSRFCRCDARNGYIEEGFSPPETGTYDPCRNKPFRCVKATPCNAVNEIPQERMLNYTCKPECQDGYGRNETSDECRLLASPAKPNSTARTTIITNATTLKSNTTTQVTTATTKPTGTDNPELSNRPLVYAIIAGVAGVVGVVLFICLRRYIQNILRQCIPHVSGHGHTEIRNNRDPSRIPVEIPLVELPGQTNGTAGTDTDPSGITVETPLVESPEQTNGTAGTDTDNNNEDNRPTRSDKNKPTKNPGTTVIIRKTANVTGDYYDAKNIVQRTGGDDSNTDVYNSDEEIKPSQTKDETIQAKNKPTRTVIVSPENKDGSEVSKNNSDIMYMDDEGDDSPESDGQNSVGNLGNNNSDGKLDKNIANFNDRRDRTSSVSEQPSARHHRQRKMSKSLGSLEVEIKVLARFKMTNDQSEGFGKRVLNKCYTYLIENLDIESTLDQCQEKELQTAIQIKDIKSVKPSDRVRDTLDHISKGGIRKYEKFKECLYVTKQYNLLKHLQDMEESQNKEDLGFGKRVLNKCYTYLIENLDIESTLDQCQEKELLTAIQIKDIKSVKPSDSVRDTLDHISKGGIRKYEKFKECLYVTKQYNLLKYLQDMEESQNKEDLGGEDSSRMAESNESIKQQEITEIKVLDKLIQILNHDELVEKFFNEKAALINLENFSSNDIQSMSTSEKETLGKNAEAICLEMDTITKHAMELVSSHPVDYVCRRAEDLKQDAIQVQQMIKLHSGKRYTHLEQLQEVLCESVKTDQKQKQEQSKIKERLLQNCQEAGLNFRGETPANGNCFFEAISSQLERLGLPWQSAEELRRNVTQFLSKNSQFDGPDQNSIIDKKFLEDKTLDDYIMKMAKNGEYADHVIIYVMSKYLQRDITIIQSSPNTCLENCICTIGDGFKGDGLLLGHYWEYHYQSLEPKNC